MAETVDFELPRKIAQITLARVGNYEELNAPTEGGGKGKFFQKTRELWKDFAVHGVFGKDKTGKETILNFTDLDGRCALGLLNLAGIDTKNVQYIAPSTHIEGKINLDTGDKHGVVIEDGGRTAFFDHHTDNGGNNTSATKLVYEGLVSVGLLFRSKYLDNLVDHVTKIDNNTYPEKIALFDDSYRTIIGLQRFIQFDKLLAFFKAKRIPGDILTGADLKWLDLEKRSEQQKGLVEESKKKLAQLLADGFIIETEKYGRAVIDIGKGISAGFDAVQSAGFQTYVIWSPENNSFFVTSMKPLEIKLSQGIKVRGKMWIKPRQDEAPLTVTLKDILYQLTGGKFEARGKLLEYLDKEASK
jgi:hypothetical protein